MFSSDRPLYRITLSGDGWHVRRPHATMDHAFDTIEHAEAFVRTDSGGHAQLVELVAETTYMVKKLAPGP